MKRMGIKKSPMAVLRENAVLVIAAVCAAVSMIWMPPDAAYADYIDWRVLSLLFCLMAVVAGLQSCGLFDVLAQKMLSGRRPMRAVVLALVLLPFFTSMLITNDVALLVFVPFAVLVMERIGREEHLAYVIALQTVAANLGSMATPVGNPQNLYIYSAFSLTAGPFFAVVLPLTAVSLAGVCLGALAPKGETIEVHFQQPQRIQSRPRLAMLAGLFLLCLLTVFRLLPFGTLLGVTVLLLLLFARDLFRRVDFGLLLTFVCFFIFAGNLGRLEGIRTFLSGLMESHAALTAGLASQVISNVPAAVLLSGFTDRWRPLLVGVDVGGLGTPIASLASLISLKFYVRSRGARPAKYLLVFTALNAAGLVLLSAAAFLLG